MRRKHSEHGSGLIELMMVLGIVATLAALALPTYVNSHQRAKTVAEETERQQAEVQRQLEEFLASDTPPVITAP